MRLLTLDLEHIGPIDEAHLDFRVSPESDPQARASSKWVRRSARC